MNDPVLLLVLVVVLVAGGMAMRPRTEVRSPGLALVRVLLPSWRFFDAISAVPEVMVRTGGDAGEWRLLLVPPRRSWANLVWHPAGNLALARHSLIERLLTDVAELPDGAEPGETVSYRLVRNLVRAELRTSGAAPATRYQWKVVDADAMTGAPGEDLLVSPEEAL